MENKRVLKSYGEFMSCEDIDLIERLDYHYFNLKEVIELFSLNRGFVKKFIDYNNVRIYEGKSYIDCTDFRKLAIMSGNDNMTNYLNEVIRREEHYQWYGSNMDEYIRDNENIDDIEKYYVESHIYNDTTNLIYGKGDNIKTESIDDEIFIQTDEDLDQSLDKIYKTLSCGEHNNNE